MNEFESLGDAADRYADHLKKKKTQDNEGTRRFEMNQRECQRIAREIILPVFQEAKRFLDKRRIPCEVISESSPSELFSTKLRVQSPNGKDWQIFTFHTNQQCETFQSGATDTSGNWKSGSPNGWGYGGVTTELVTRELKAFLSEVLA